LIAALARQNSTGMAAQTRRAFEQNHKGSAYTDNAIYWMGECELSLKDYGAAVKTFERLVRQYPSTPKARDAYLRMAESWRKLGNDKKAEEALEKVANATQSGRSVEPTSRNRG
jgi:TolA-binding protein